MKLIFKLILLIFVLEIFFRFVVPASSQPYSVYIKQYNTLAYEPNTSGLYTGGSFSQQRAEWRVNNYGWLSNIDYETGKDKSRVAIIGDSFVEGLQVGTQFNIRAALDTDLKGEYTVYSFASGGFCLTQYLQLSRYAKSLFDPDIYVFCIVDGDIKDSLTKSGIRNDQLKVEVIDDIAREKEVSEYKPSIFKRLLRKSAVVRYFYFNKLRDRVNKKKDNKDIIEKKHEIVIDYVFSRLRKELDGKRILIVRDASRNDSFYDKNNNFIDLTLEESVLLRYANKYGLEYVNLSSDLRSIYLKDGLYFEFENDFHWNEYGNKKVAEIISKRVNAK